MNTVVTTDSALANRTGLVAVLCLLVLQWAWPGRLLPVVGSPHLFVAAVSSLPLAVLAFGLWRKWPRARFWSGVAALFYFCHGIAEAWAMPASWLAGTMEAFLSVATVLACSWNGLRARLGAKPRPNV